MHDPDTKFCVGFDGILEALGIHAGKVAAAESEPERPFGEMASFGERGVFVKVE